MKIDIEDIFIRYEIPNWDRVRRLVLETIEKGPWIKVGYQDGTTISKTNFYLQDIGGGHFAYGPEIEDILRGFLNAMHHRGMSSDFRGSMWHQVYERGDCHNWHTHPQTNMSSVFYVQCPDEKSGTVFKVGEHEYHAPAKDGEILSFPSSLLHRTMEHDNDIPKIVMSFNWNYNGLTHP